MPKTKPEVAKIVGGLMELKEGQKVEYIVNEIKETFKSEEAYEKSKKEAYGRKEKGSQGNKKEARLELYLEIRDKFKKMGIW